MPERNMRMRIYWGISAVLFVFTAFGCRSEVPKMKLDTLLRGELTLEQWESFDDIFKFGRCLRYKISEMRKRVSEVSGPIALLEYYPEWLDGLESCLQLYKIDHHQADILQEAVAAEMAKVLGKETASYLDIQRLYKNHRPKRERIDMWRIFAITGVAEVANVLANKE